MHKPPKKWKFWPRGHFPLINSTLLCGSFPLFSSLLIFWSRCDVTAATCWKSPFMLSSSLSSVYEFIDLRAKFVLQIAAETWHGRWSFQLSKKERWKIRGVRKRGWAQSFLSGQHFVAYWARQEICRNVGANHFCSTKIYKHKYLTRKIVLICKTNLQNTIKYIFFFHVLHYNSKSLIVPCNNLQHAVFCGLLQTWHPQFIQALDIFKFLFFTY